MISIFLGTYLFIGILLVAFSPARKRIAEEVDKARGTEFTNSMLGRKQPSEQKILLFRLTLTLGFVLLWSIFVWSILKEYQAAQSQSSTEDSEKKACTFISWGDMEHCHARTAISVKTLLLLHMAPVTAHQDFSVRPVENSHPVIAKSHLKIFMAQTIVYRYPNYLPIKGQAELSTYKVCLVYAKVR